MLGRGWQVRLHVVPCRQVPQLGPACKRDSRHALACNDAGLRKLPPASGQLRFVTSSSPEPCCGADTSALLRLDDGAHARPRMCAVNDMF